MSSLTLNVFSLCFSLFLPQWDKMMVSILAIIAGVEDINLLASQQFKAKSKELQGLSASQAVNRCHPLPLPLSLSLSRRVHFPTH